MPTKMEYYYEQCDESLMKDIKKTIQDSLSEMIDGSSTLIRLLFFITKKSESTRKQYEKLESNGKLKLWISTFNNLVHKIDTHFSELINLLCSFIKVNPETDIKKQFLKFSSDFGTAIDKICPIKSQVDKQKFFITQICEQKGKLFTEETGGNSSDEELMKKQGVLSKSERPDGKGLHIVGESIAPTQQSPQPKDLFKIRCYETGITEGKPHSNIQFPIRQPRVHFCNLNRLHLLHRRYRRGEHHRWDQLREHFQP